MRQTPWFALFASILFSVYAIPASIPYYNGPPLSVDSGYIPINNIRLFYLHVAALNNPSTAPVVFWFQGGPGGSSMIGAFVENGPWNILSSTSVQYKDLNWIHNANMVFIDQPACVGFSYSLNLADCNSSDIRAAAVNVQAIKTFLYKIMPQYKGRAFWFTGESYAGAYVPMLSALVVDDAELNPSFAGFMVGNPVMECYAESDPQEFGVGDTWSYFNQLYWNGYVDHADYELWRSSGCESESHRHGVDSPQCDTILNKVSSQKNLGIDFDPDDAFTDYCTGNGTLEFATTQCDDDSGTLWSILDDYLKQETVATALNAHQIYESQLNYFFYTQDAFGGMNQYYEHVLSVKPTVHILVYSGLSDIFTVPFSYTMPCINNLALKTKAKVKVPWTTWHSNSDRHAHAGHWKQWSNGVTYATVRGAGHEVPTFQPYTAMLMFDRFLKNFNVADDF